MPVLSGGNMMSHIRKSKDRIRDPRKAVRSKIILLVLSILLVGTLLGSVKPYDGIPYVISATSQKDVDDAKAKKEETENQLDEVQKTVDALQGEAEDLESDLAYLNDLSEEQKIQYEEIALELQAALSAKQVALVLYLSSEADLDTKKTQYSERMSAMFEYQNRSLLEVLLESDSVAGFFTNLEIVSLIGEADQQALDELQIAMDDAALKSAYAQQEALDMQAVADEKQAELDELKAKIGTTEEALEEKESELSDWEKKENDLNAKADSLDKEIADLQKKLANPATPPPEGTMTWPYPGDYKIYSKYGMRMHPIYKYMKMHYGVDLGGAYGNPIVAAADGIVLKVSKPVDGQNTGGKDYGNYIVIDHGGGVSTLYAHCKYIYASVGDSVVAGEKIAACGSTGASTGPHLHFEVRVGSDRVNPANYIT
jgi:murein DD-endopeptidase MepM/ murein hydrolase activator NlpD